MRILVIEDEVRIADNIKKYFMKAGFIVDSVDSGEDAVYQFDVNSYDIVILDRMLPDAEGLEICKYIRKSGKPSAIVMLTAKSQLEDKLEGFEAGADDYISKPFAMEELEARVQAVLKRKLIGVNDAVIRVNDLTIDTNTCTVRVGKNMLELSPKEYSMLEYLVMNKNKAISREELMEHIWGDALDAFSNTVDVHIRYLRKKLDKPGEDSRITTVKGKGYMICEK